MVPHLAGRRIYHGFGLLAPTTLPYHPTHSLTMLHVKHDHDHGQHAPPLIEGCGRHVTTHRELLATSSEQRRRAGQRVAGGVQFTAGWSLNIPPRSEWRCSEPHLALGGSVFTKTPSPSSLPPWQLPSHFNSCTRTQKEAYHVFICMFYNTSHYLHLPALAFTPSSRHPASPLQPGM